MYPFLPLFVGIVFTVLKFVVAVLVIVAIAYLVLKIVR